MRAFVCKHCPLAFKVGSYVYWDLTGSCDRLVCLHCGTMHKFEEINDVGQVFALPAPVRSLPKVTKRTESGDEYEDYEWPFEEKDWRLVGYAPKVEVYEQRLWVMTHLPCGHCRQAGKLVSLELPKGPAGEWPIFGDTCPLCGGALPWVYDCTIN
jgi:hypothetical protein